MSETTATPANNANNANLNNANNQEPGLEIQVCEFEDDTVYSVAPGAAAAASHCHHQQEYDDDVLDSSSDEENEVIDGDFPLLRSASSIEEPSTPKSSVAAPTADSNIKRVDFSDEATTAKILTFLETRGINTNKLVQEHMIKYGSRARYAVDDDGNIVGFALFDNEVIQEMLNGASETEIERFMESKPFIFFQLLIVDDPYHAGTAARNDMWSKRLIESVTACIVKNGKIGIVRVDVDSQEEIEKYRSCGFYTMEDMGVPSYSTTKDKVAVLGYTPLGLEQTAEIFKKFYSRGARF
jgi:hypothetical protein